MSNLRISDAGIQTDQEILRLAWNAAVYTLHLFSNNHVPSDADNLTNYIEAVYGGYAPLAISTWGAASLGTHVAVTAAAPLTFTVGADTPGSVVYGYYITDAGVTTLLWAERYDSAPAPMDTAGQTFTVNLQRSFKSEFS